MNKNHKDTVEVIKVIVAIYVIGNLLSAAAGYFFNDGAIYDREFVVKTTISAGLGVFLLFAIEVLDWIETKRWKKKSKDLFYGDTGYGLLKCSRGYFQLPIMAVLMDLMLGVLLWQEFGGNLDGYMNFMKEESKLVPIITILFFNSYSVFVVLYYGCYKLYYTKYGIQMVHFLKKVNISCGEIQKISYHYMEKKEREIIIIETREKKIEVRSDILPDGWDQFMDYILDMSEQRNIMLE